jgi:hypothetical protein
MVLWSYGLIVYEKKFYRLCITWSQAFIINVLSVTKAFVTGLFRAILTAFLPGRKKAGSLRENMELLATKSPMFFQKHGTYLLGVSS